jgi:hypothetical protein
MKRTIHTTARWICLALGVLLSLSLTAPNAAAKPVALFYLGTDPNSVRSFLAHYKQIDLLVPTWYDLDSDGLLTGEPDPTVLEVAHRDKLPVMPIVAFFNKKGFHEFRRQSRGMAAHERGHGSRSQAPRLHRLPVRL